MQKDTRLYRLEMGLQELLVIAAGATLEDAVTRWRAEIESGEVSHQARQVIIAMGWVTSDRDWRMALVGPRRTRRSKNTPDLAPVAEAGAELERIVRASESFTVPISGQTRKRVDEIAASRAQSEPEEATP